MNEKLTYKQKDLVLEALNYYKTNATEPNKEVCGLDGYKKKLMNQSIDKITRFA